jgi:uncharacterized Ntn-hydrolase superfamily protein
VTYSIVALDRATGDLGVAVQSKFLAVGAVVTWAQAGNGAIATQSFANVAYGPDGLRLLGDGLSATGVLARSLQPLDNEWLDAETLEARTAAPGWIDPRALTVLRSRLSR